MTDGPRSARAPYAMCGHWWSGTEGISTTGLIVPAKGCLILSPLVPKDPRDGFIIKTDFNNCPDEPIARILPTHRRSLEARTQQERQSLQVLGDQTCITVRILVSVQEVEGSQGRDSNSVRGLEPKLDLWPRDSNVVGFSNLWFDRAGQGLPPLHPVIVGWEETGVAGVRSQNSH